MSTLPMRHPHLRQLHDDALAVTARVERLKENYTPEQLAWKPDAQTWNMLECIDHLRASGDVYYPRLQASAARAEPGGTTPYRPSLTGRMMIFFVSPDTTFKVKTFKTFEPAEALTDPAVLDRFIAGQETLYDLLERADGLELNGSKFASPVSGLIRFTLGDGLTVMVRHQQRHLQQAERLALRLGFPGR